MKFRVLEAAEIESTEAAWWYEEQRLGLGEEFLDALKDTYSAIQKSPGSATQMDLIERSEMVFWRRLKRFPYLVIYSIRREDVFVLAVSHTRRHPSYWLDRIGD